MKLTMNTYLYIAAAALVLVAGLMIGSAWSERKIRSIEAEAETDRANTSSADKIAAEREAEAAGYREKITYLEAEIAKAKQARRKDDEQIEVRTSNSRRARADVQRARGTRAVDTGRDELCAKLSQLGHGC
jgi:hypothetical protein